MPARREPFVGRRAALATLLERLAAVEQGHGETVLIAGEPGIGKTRLAEEFTARVRAEGVRVHWGHCDEGGGVPAFWPWMQVARTMLRPAPGEAPPLRWPGDPAVAYLLPELQGEYPAGTDLPVGEPEQALTYLLDRLTTVLCRAAADQPAVLVLDDLQWADTPSLRLLLHLARRLAFASRHDEQDQPMRLLLVGMHRAVDADGGHPLAGVLADMRRERLAVPIALDPLTAEESAALIGEMAGSAIDPAVARALHHRTDGNTFFVTEFVRHLLAGGCDLTDPDAVAAERAVPEGVRQVIGQRVARLRPETVAALRAAAVLGDGFAADLLAAASGLSESAVLDALDEAARAGIVTGADGGYRFSHALIRQTVYAGLGVARRQRLHQRAAAAIERLRSRNLTPYRAALAMHLRLAGPAADPERALASMRRAAEAAEAAFAWAEAATHRRAALELIGSGREAERCDALIALGWALRRAADGPGARTVLSEAGALARTLPAPERLAAAALAYPSAAAGATDATQVSLLEAALGGLEGGDSPLRARLLAQLGGARYWSDAPERSLPAVREAVAMAHRLGDPATLAYTLVREQQLLRGPDHLDERRNVAEALVRLGQEIGDPRLELEGRYARQCLRLEQGEIAALDREADAYFTLAAGLHQSSYLDNQPIFQAMRAILDGRIEEGCRRSEQARVRQEAVNNPYAARIHHWQLLMARHGPRWPDDLVAGFEAFARQSPAVPSYRAALALLYAEGGRTAEARAEFDALAAGGFSGLRRDYAWPMLMALLAEACAALADGGRATALSALLLPYAGRLVAFEVVACFGAVDRFLGLLAATVARSEPAGPAAGRERWQTAAGHFEAALALHARIGARAFVALTQRDYAAMLVHRGAPGDVARAGELLDRAEATFTEIGMVRDAAAARAQRPLVAGADATGGPVYPDGLTEREVEVLRLLAAGAGNRAIAEALVISVRTAEHHVASIYQKIGAEGATARAAATAYAFRQGLAVPSGTGS